METYKLFFDVESGKNISVYKKIDNLKTISIPFDPANTDYQKYLAWLEEGNIPEPAEE